MSSDEREPTTERGAGQDSGPGGLTNAPESVDGAPAGGAVDAEPADGTGPNTRAVVGKAALIILAATLVGRLLGLARESSVAYFFGAEATTDAFFLAYKLPYLISLTVAGALTATFVPVFTHRWVTGRQDEAWGVTANLANVIGLILIAITVGGIAFAPWIIPLIGPGFDEPTRQQAVELFRLLMPGVVFAGLAGLATGVLNSLKRFALPAFAGSAAAAVAIAAMAVGADTWGISSLAVGTTVGVMVSFVVLLPQMHGAGMRWSARVDRHQPGLREVGMMVWPILIGSAVGKVSIFVDQVLGSLLGEGSISALNYSEKLFQLPLGLFVAGITIPIFPLLSEHVAAGQPERVKSTLGFALRLIAFVMIPASVGLIVLATPLVALLFQHGRFTADDTALTASALVMYSIGLFAYAGRDTLTRVFYAYQDTRTPVVISVAAVVVNIGCSYLLMQFIGVAGLALGTTIALTVNFVVLIELMRRRLGPMGFGALGRSVARIAAASLAMGFVVKGVDLVLAERLTGTTGGTAVRVACGIGAGVAAYLAVAAVIRLPELREVLDMLRSALGRTRVAQDTTGAR